ncbi:MAG: hypothetical protein ABSD68_02195 [Candidatus Micrarchaeales archaeon]
MTTVADAAALCGSGCGPHSGQCAVVVDIALCLAVCRSATAADKVSLQPQSETAAATALA